MTIKKEVVIMGRISLRLTDKEDALIRNYAKVYDMELSSFIREVVMEKIEDDYDLKLFDKIWEETKDEETYSHEEVKKELGL